MKKITEGCVLISNCFNNGEMVEESKVLSELGDFAPDVSGLGNIN